jgi:hypothetical protein
MSMARHQVNKAERTCRDGLSRRLFINSLAQIGRTVPWYLWKSNTAHRSVVYPSLRGFIDSLPSNSPPSQKLCQSCQNALFEPFVSSTGVRDRPSATLDGLHLHTEAGIPKPLNQGYTAPTCPADKR